MLLRRRLQISNEMADGEVGLDVDHLIIRTCDVLKMWRRQHRADIVGETRRVGEGDVNSRNFVWSSTLWTKIWGVLITSILGSVSIKRLCCCSTKIYMLCCSDSASFVMPSSSQSWSSTIDSLISSFLTKLRLCSFEFHFWFICEQSFRFDNVN